jgi:membrane fusion protein, multidrug efflux system
MAFKTKLIVVLALGGVGYMAYSHFMVPGGAGGMMQGGAAPVSVAEVIERNVQQWHDFSGRLVAVDRVDIRPRVSGTVDKVYFADGDVVKAGTPLFTIDPRPYEAALQAATARAVLADAELKRARMLIADKAIPQREYDQRKNDAAVAHANLTQAKLNLEYTQITAPIDGRLSRAEITVGNLVEAGSSAPVLTSMVSSDPMYADFEVDEATYLQYVQAKSTQNGSSAKIPVSLALMGDNGFPYKGRIESFDNKLDVTSGTIRVRAAFDNPTGILVPGLFARVRVGETKPTKAVLITDRAVGTDQSKRYVLVVGADNKVEYREVHLGAMAEGLRVVTSGLKAGEKIVVNGLQRARPGQPVTPETVSMDDRGSLDQIKPAAGKTAKETKPQPAAGPESESESEVE